VNGPQASLPATPRFQRRQTIVHLIAGATSDFALKSAEIVARTVPKPRKILRFPELFRVEATRMQARMPALQSRCSSFIGFPELFRVEATLIAGGDACGPVVRPRVCLPVVSRSPASGWILAERPSASSRAPEWPPYSYSQPVVWEWALVLGYSRERGTGSVRWAAPSSRRESPA